MGGNNTKESSGIEMGDKSSMNTNGANSENCQLIHSLFEGHWIEIARYKNNSESGCKMVKISYKWDTENEVMYVKNTCIYQDGNKKTMKGKGVPDGKHSCRLTVTYQTGTVVQYWILWTDYDKWALIGSPNRNNFWILSREWYISRDDFKLITGYAASLGYGGPLVVNEDCVRGYKAEWEESETRFDSDIVS